MNQFFNSGREVGYRVDSNLEKPGNQGKRVLF